MAITLEQAIDETPPPPCDECPDRSKCAWHQWACKGFYLYTQSQTSSQGIARHHKFEPGSELAERAEAMFEPDRNWWERSFPKDDPEKKGYRRRR